jgi:hypothetical protein
MLPGLLLQLELKGLVSQYAGKRFGLTPGIDRPQTTPLNRSKEVSSE